MIVLRYENFLPPIEMHSDHSPTIHKPKTRGRSSNIVQSVMALLRDRYDSNVLPSNGTTGSSSCVVDDEEIHPTLDDWTKMRRCLYRVTTTSNAEDRGGLSIYKVQKVLDFLEEVIPDRHIQRSILIQAPRILTKNVNTRLRPTVEFLQSLYGGALFVTAISRNPNLLLTYGTGYTGDDDLHLVETFLRTDLGLNQNSINKLKRSDPQLFQLSMVQLLSVVSYLRHLLETHHQEEEVNIGVPFVSATTTKTITKLIVTHPMIFQLSVTDNLGPRIQYLQERCHLLDTDLATLLKSSSAAVLGLSVKENLEPTIDLLSTKLSNTELRKVILSHAQILGLSLDNLRTKIAYFDTIDKMSQTDPVESGKPSLASRILMKAPAVYSLSLTGNIVPTVKFLAKVWGQPSANDETNVSDKNISQGQYDSSTNLATLLSECPSILTVSLDGNIKPTISFFVRTGYMSLDSEGALRPNADGKAAIIRGRYITASLFHRLLPRWHYHLKQQDNGKKQSFMAPPLYVLAGTTDVDFCARLGYDINDYMTFRDESAPRLKFSSQFETWIQTGRPIDT